MERQKVGSASPTIGFFAEATGVAYLPPSEIYRFASCDSSGIVQLLQCTLLHQVLLQSQLDNLGIGADGCTRILQDTPASLKCLHEQIYLVVFVLAGGRDYLYIK